MACVEDRGWSTELSETISWAGLLLGSGSIERDARRPMEGDRAAERIIHFSGNIKPWVVREAMDFDTAYFRVLDETAWHGWRPKRTLARLALGWYGSSRLRRVAYPAEQWGMQIIRKLTQTRALTR